MEAAITVMAWVRLVLLIIASAYGLLAIRSLSKAKNQSPIIRIKRKVFTLLAAAVFLFTIGVATIQVGSLFAEQNFPSIADIPIALSNLLVIFAFTYFWAKTAKIHKTNISDRAFFVATVCAVLTWLVFLFITSVTPNIEGEYLFAQILYWFYPIATSLMFISTMVVNPRLKAAVITTPLWYISAGVFLHFIAFMINYYTIWHPMTLFIPGIYAFLYVLSAGFFVIGFYTISRKYS
jgi:hypothetical protein